MEMIQEANESILAHKDDDHTKPPASGLAPEKQKAKQDEKNKGTLILDASCTPSNIRYLGQNS